MSNSKKAVFAFDGETMKSLKNKTINDIQGDKNKKITNGLKDTLLDLSTGEQNKKLHDRGYVVVVDGWWGVGKSTTTWAVINGMKEENRERFVVIDKSFLPFGNINESISDFLNNLSETLIEKNILNISKEIRQFILESTSRDENFNASIKLGPMSFSKKFLCNKYNTRNIEILINKFSTMSRKGKTVLLVIDDLDRLRPCEVVTVLRMVEKLRVLPNIIVLLPINKEIITNAISNDLKIDGSSANTFLRKQVDRSVLIESGYIDLKNIFYDVYNNLPDDALIKDKKYTIQWGIKKGQPYGDEIKLIDLVWALFAHITIVSNILGMGDPDSMYNIKLKSQYLDSLLKLFSQTRSRAKNTVGIENIFPVYNYNEPPNEWTSIGDNYSFSNEGEIIKKLANPDSSASVVVLDEEFMDKIRNERGVLYSEEIRDSIEEKNKIPIFVEVFMKQLDDLDNEDDVNGRNEPMISDFLKRRDVRIIASDLFARINEDIETFFVQETRKEDIILSLFDIVSRASRI